MNTRLCLIMACLLLSACQTQREKFTSIWSPAEVVEEAAAHPTSYDDNILDNPLGQNHEPAISRDPNKLLTLTDVSGNREYLLLDSIAQERGILTALIEFRYVRPQTLPSNGMTYHCNQWREQIDCKNKVRILRTTTHYNLAGEIVDTRDYPLPKYKPAELAALSQPDDKAIQYVCSKTGATGLAVGDAAVATTAKDDPKANSKNTKSNKSPETEKSTEKSVEKTETTSKNKKTKNKSTKAQEDKVKVDEKIDFINKNKEDNKENKTDTSPAAADEKSNQSKETETQSTEKTNKKGSKKTQSSKKTQKSTAKNPEANNERPIPSSPAIKEVEDEAMEGEMPLKPL